MSPKPPKSRRAWNSTIADPTKPLPSKSRKRMLSDAKPKARKARKAVKRVNVKRKAKEFARAYGSVERVEFVKVLLCAACARFGRSENAHLMGNGGAGRKGHFTTIGALCGSAFASLGCHQMYDEYPDTFKEMYPKFDPEEVSARTEAEWQSHQRETVKHRANWSRS